MEGRLRLENQVRSIVSSFELVRIFSRNQILSSLSNPEEAHQKQVRCIELVVYSVLLHKYYPQDR